MGMIPGFDSSFMAQGNNDKNSQVGAGAAAAADCSWIGDCNMRIVEPGGVAARLRMRRGGLVCDQ